MVVVVVAVAVPGVVVAALPLTLSTCPTAISSAFANSFRLTRASTVVLNRAAISESVSPSTTVYEPAGVGLAEGVGDAVRAPATSWAAVLVAGGCVLVGVSGAASSPPQAAAANTSRRARKRYTRGPFRRPERMALRDAL